MVTSTDAPSTMTTVVLPVSLSDITYPPDAYTEHATIAPGSATETALNKAATILRAGGVVALPTETVYGLGADARSTPAVRGIFAAKNRPSDNPLIVHVASVPQLMRLLKIPAIPEIYAPLVARFWPGPLTIVLPLPAVADGDAPMISPACTPGQDTVAVRMPAHPVARALIALSDVPVAAPSANASTRPSPTTAAHVLRDMNGRVPLILDDGSACDVGVESTVVDGTVFPPAVLRPGGVSVEQIREAGGDAWKNVIFGSADAAASQTVRTPGMKYRHYSPRARVVLIVGPDADATAQAYILSEKALGKVAVLPARGFNVPSWPSAAQGRIACVMPLGIAGPDIARNLFAHLRDADDAGVDTIVVEGVDENDEGAAIMNRLRKAASEIYEHGQHIIKH
ncbi:DHBP synthase RibB-like alpha/beta domain-containing protein [Limtongia smithiae]|uniref:DHBP synthase RibB-like alpha/beta domain-containing protein n=1 Tax=Limtongia smithiae TaxID=1125753 RepID=UPI0034CFB748